MTALMHSSLTSCWNWDKPDFLNRLAVSRFRNFCHTNKFMASLPVTFLLQFGVFSSFSREFSDNYHNYIIKGPKGPLELQNEKSPLISTQKLSQQQVLLCYYLPGRPTILNDSDSPRKNRLAVHRFRNFCHRNNCCSTR